VGVLPYKIYVYDSRVQEMLQEYRQRIRDKREQVAQIEKRYKQMTLQEPLVVCSRCQAEVNSLKQFSYMKSDQLHHVKGYGSMRAMSFKEVEAEYEDHPLFKQWA